jgi:palmitoyl-protein thioesterase
VPKESGWFAEVNETSGVVTGLRERRLYREDWIGLRQLDEKGGLVFESVQGEHMELDEEELERTFGRYFGAERVLGGGMGSGQQQVMAEKKDL